MLALGLQLVLGYGGILQLGYAGFFGLGAYTSAILTVKLGLALPRRLRRRHGGGGARAPCS